MIVWLAPCSGAGVSTLPNSKLEAFDNGAPEPTIQSAIELLKTSKLAANRRQVYVSELVRSLRQISRGMEDKPLSYLDAPRIESFLASRQFCPLVRKSFIGKVSTLFEFCKRRKLTRWNPCTELEIPIVEWKPPIILTPAQIEKLFRHAQQKWPERVVYLTLCTFTGLRPTEARQVSREAVNIDAGTIRVEAGISKIRQRRIVNMHPTAIEWLKHSLPTARLQIKESTRKAWVSEMSDFMKLDKHWPQDCLRHSCASYLLTIKQDAGYVALQLGNSPAILFRHYRELVSAEDAALFWSILPK